MTLEPRVLEAQGDRRRRLVQISIESTRQHVEEAVGLSFTAIARRLSEESGWAAPALRRSSFRKSFRRSFSRLDRTGRERTAADHAAPARWMGQC